MQQKCQIEAPLAVYFFRHGSQPQTGIGADWNSLTSPGTPLWWSSREFREFLRELTKKKQEITNKTKISSSVFVPLQQLPRDGRFCWRELGFKRKFSPPLEIFSYLHTATQHLIQHGAHFVPSQPRVSLRRVFRQSKLRRSNFSTKNT